MCEALDRQDYIPMLDTTAVVVHLYTAAEVVVGEEAAKAMCAQYMAPCRRDWWRQVAGAVSNFVFFPFNHVQVLIFNF